MRSSLKRLLVKSPFERPVHALLRLFAEPRQATRQAPAWKTRALRDEAHVDRILRMRLSSDSNCIDIGARQGAFLARFLTYCPEGHQVAFEPLPELAAELKRRYPAAEVHAIAFERSTRPRLLLSRNRSSGLERATTSVVSESGHG